MLIVIAHQLHSCSLPATTTHAHENIYQGSTLKPLVNIHPCDTTLLSHFLTLQSLDVCPRHHVLLVWALHIFMILAVLHAPHTHSPSGSGHRSTGTWGEPGCIQLPWGPDSERCHGNLSLPGTDNWVPVCWKGEKSMILHMQKPVLIAASTCIPLIVCVHWFGSHCYGNKVELCVPYPAALLELTQVPLCSCENQDVPWIVIELLFWVYDW